MQFVCRYGTPDGRILTQVQQGGDELAVRRELERQGFHIFEVRPRGIALSKDGSKLFICTSDDNHIEVLDTETLKIVRTLPSGSSLSTISAALPSSTSRRASTPSSGRACHAVGSATMPSGSSFMRSPTISATSCAHWLCRRLSIIGR